MNTIIGVIFHFIGGFASGSFYVPYRKVQNWSWEAMWIFGGLFSWIIVPPLAAWIIIPNFWDIIIHTPFSTLGYTFLFGLLWGIGGLTYGLGVRYLGVALGSSIILGLSMVFGALMPSVYYFFNSVADKHGIDYYYTTTAGSCVLIGLLVCLLGIYWCGKAGMRKEKDLQETEKGLAEYNFGLGVVVALVSGILSACFNFGLEAGKPMAAVANELWKAANPGQGEFLFQNNVTYVVVLWGGFATNALWCLYLLLKNNTLSDYSKPSAPLLKNMAL